jgi:hypothetical protein
VSPFAMNWHSYPSVLDLKAEYMVHFEQLRDPNAAINDRTFC